MFRCSAFCLAALYFADVYLADVCWAARLFPAACAGFPCILLRAPCSACLAAPRSTILYARSCVNGQFGNHRSCCARIRGVDSALGCGNLAWHATSFRLCRTLRLAGAVAASGCMALGTVASGAPLWTPQGMCRGACRHSRRASLLIHDGTPAQDWTLRLESSASSPPGPLAHGS